MKALAYVQSSPVFWEMGVADKTTAPSPVASVPSGEASKKENMVILNFPAVPVHFKLKSHFYNLMRLSYKLLPDNGVCLVNSLTHVEQFVLSKYLSSFYFIYVYDEHLVCIISFTFWLVQH